MVTKAARLGVGLLAAISAPTALAVELARASRLTLVAFLRPGRHVVYTHPHRIPALGLEAAPNPHPATTLPSHGGKV